MWTAIGFKLHLDIFIHEKCDTDIFSSVFEISFQAKEISQQEHEQALERITRKFTPLTILTIESI